MNGTDTGAYRQTAFLVVAGLHLHTHTAPLTGSSHTGRYLRYNGD